MVLEKDEGMGNSCKNEKLLRKDKTERNILHTMEGRNDYSIGRLVRKNCLLKRRIDGKIEVREDEEQGVNSYRMTSRKCFGNERR
jgi:hypothetical protein